MSFYSDFAESYEEIFPFSPQTASFLEQWAWPPPARILDIGCGTGHYCGWLARRGFEAHGFDLDPEMIRVARSRYPEADFSCLDMRALTDLEGPFKAVFCIGNTAAHLTPEELSAVLGTVRSLLEPGGTWVVQVLNWDFLLTRESFTFPVIESPDGTVRFFREYPTISEQGTPFQTRLEREGATVFKDRVTLYPLPTDTFIALHEQAGFKCLDHFASYGSAAFDPAVMSPSIFVFKATE
ncbi:MAG TPA: class I SAM-dependent methyltransferase [Desulfomicrobiaceae bacterium]|nr:class I SAM-dependent methyltransferase [Desulfomicrobiaceae bacterium]